MKRLLVVLLAAAAFAPLAAEAQGWAYPAVAYPPAVVYMPPPPPVVVMQPPPVVVQPAPRIIFLAPPSSPPQPAPVVERRLETPSAQVNTTCTQCTVTNNVTVGERSPVVAKTPVAPRRAKPAVRVAERREATRPAAAASDDAGYMGALYTLIALLLVAVAVLVSRLMGRRRPSPSAEPAAPGTPGACVAPEVAAAPATPRAPAPPARPTAADRPRVHSKKCPHKDCPHTLTICCHGDSTPAA